MEYTTTTITQYRYVALKWAFSLNFDKLHDVNQRELTYFDKLVEWKLVRESVGHFVDAVTIPDLIPFWSTSVKVRSDQTSCSFMCSLQFFMYL